MVIYMHIFAVFLNFRQLPHDKRILIHFRRHRVRRNCQWLIFFV